MQLAVLSDHHIAVDHYPGVNHAAGTKAHIGCDHSPGTDMNAFAAAGVTAKDTDYIASTMADKVIAKTKMIGGGESDAIEFKAPAAGTYDFLCTFPGHSAIMKGKLIVK